VAIQSTGRAGQAQHGGARRLAGSRVREGGPAGPRSAGMRQSAGARCWGIERRELRRRGALQGVDQVRAWSKTGAWLEAGQHPALTYADSPGGGGRPSVATAARPSGVEDGGLPPVARCATFRLAMRARCGTRTRCRPLRALRSRATRPPVSRCAPLRDQPSGSTNLRVVPEPSGRGRSLIARVHPPAVLASGRTRSLLGRGYPPRRLIGAERLRRRLLGT